MSVFLFACLCVYVIVSLFRRASTRFYVRVKVSFSPPITGIQDVQGADSTDGETEYFSINANQIETNDAQHHSKGDTFSSECKASLAEYDSETVSIAAARGIVYRVHEYDAYVFFKKQRVVGS